MAAKYEGLKRGPKIKNGTDVPSTSSERTHKFRDQERKAELLAIEKREKRKAFKFTSAELFLIDSCIKSREPQSDKEMANLKYLNPEMFQNQLDYEDCLRLQVSWMPEETRSDRLFDAMIDDDVERYTFFTCRQDVLTAIEQGRG